MNYSFNIFIVLLSIIIGTLNAQAITCFDTTFPKLLGGTFANTEFTVMDIDSSLNMVIGGQSSDSEILLNASPPNPLAVLMNYGGLYRWAMYFTTVYNSIVSISFNPAATKVLAVFDQAPLTFVLLSSNTGAILSSYSDTSSSGNVISEGAIVDSSDNIYYATQNSNNNWQLIKFQPSGSSTTSLLGYSGTTNTQAYTVTFGKDDTEVYVGGSFEWWFFGDIFYLSIAYITSSGLQYHYTQTYISGSEYYARMLRYLIQGSSEYLMGCAEYTGSEYLAFFQLYIDTSNRNLIPYWYTSVQYYVPSVTLRCLSFYVDSSALIYSIVSLNGNSYQFLIVSISSKTIQSTDLTVIQGTINHGKFFSSTQAYYVGGASGVSGVVPTQSFTYTQGYVMSLYSAESCCTYSPPTVPTSQSDAGLLWAWTANDPSSMQTTLVSTTVTATNLLSTSIPSAIWCPQKVSITITPTTISAMTYDISMTTPTTQIITQFGLSLTCSDASFIYTALLSDGVTVAPSFITITTVSGVSTISISTTNLADVNTYLIHIYGTVPTGQTAYTPITITITNLCATASITAAALTDQQYKVTQTQLSYTFPATITNPTYCKLTYTLNNVGSTGYDNTLITSFTSSTLTLTVYTTDNTKVANYPLQITATVNMNNAITINELFTLTVLHQCTTATITIPTIASIDYYILYSSAIPIYIPLFTSSLPSTLCGNFNYICQSDGATLDTSVFTFNNLVSPLSLTVQSFDRTKPGTHIITIQGYQGTFTKTFNTVTFSVVITDPCLSTTITPTTITHHSYDILQPSLPIPILPFTESVGYCGSFTYTLTNPNPSVISLDTLTNQINIYSSDFTQCNPSYIIVVTGLLTLYNTLSATTTFTLTVKYNCNLAILTPTLVNPQTYTVFQLEKQIIVPLFTSDHPVLYCGAFQYIATSQDGVTPIDSSKFTFTEDVTQNEIYVYTVDITAPGTYYILITGYQSTYTTHFTTVLVEISIYPYMKSDQIKGAPQFVEQLSDQSVTVKSSLMYQLPGILDPDTNQFKIQVLFNGNSTTPSFVVYTTQYFMFNPSDNSQVGLYEITVIISDLNLKSLSSIYYFNLYVTEYKSKSKNNNNDTQNTNSTLETKTNGTLQTQNIIATSNNPNQKDPLYALIYQVTMKGLMTVKFSKNIDIPTDYTLFGNQQLNIWVKTNNITKLNGTSLVWQITEFKTNYMTIQLIFSKPSLISNEQIPDEIHLKFVSNGYFVMTDGNIPIAQNDEIYKQLSPQISPSITQTGVTILLSMTQTGVGAGVACAGIASMMTSSSFKAAWALVNFLQLLLHLALLSVSYPQQAYAFLTLLVNLANYQFVNTGSYIAEVYNPTLNQAPVPPMFTTFGYDNINIFANLGVLVFYLIIMVAMILFTLFLRYILKKAKDQSKILNFLRIQQLHDYLKKYLFYSCIITSSIEMYLQLAVCDFIAINTLSRGDDWSSLINTTFVFLLTIGLIIFPIFIYYFLQKNQQILDIEDFKEKFDSFYGEVKYVKSSNRNYYTFFIIRRLILSANIVFLQNFTIAQIIIQIFTSLPFLIYLIKVKPWEDKYVNFIETVNEITILICSYLLLTFTDFIPNDNLKTMSGYIFMGVILLCIVINWVMLVQANILIIYAKLKDLLNYLKKRRNKNQVKQEIGDTTIVNTELNISQEFTSNSIINNRNIGSYFIKRVKSSKVQPIYEVEKLNQKQVQDQPENQNQTEIYEIEHSSVQVQRRKIFEDQSLNPQDAYLEFAFQKRKQKSFEEIIDY